jgi:signal transduction histidine kinase
MLLSVAGLLTVGVALSWRLLQAFSEVSESATADRLIGIGTAAAHAVALGAGEAQLQAICRENHLEDGYLLDASLRPLRRGAGLSLLRIDPDRAMRALAGQPSVGPAYHLEAVDTAPEPEGAPPPGEILAGYFRVPASPAGAGEARLLVLEAGAAFVATPRRLRAAVWATTAAAGALAALFLLLVLQSVRSARRERKLYGQAQRGQAISQMAAMVAHEIRNPLGTIQAGTELLREQRPDNPLIEDILEEVRRISGLTSEFLQLARDAPLELRELDLSALCDDVCGQLRRAQGPAQVQHRIERAGEDGVVIVGDAGRLRQVLLNLVLNALQAQEKAPAGGLVEVTVTRRGAFAEVLVRDEGPGIDEGLGKQLFEPFATTKVGGTGLGLVLSRRIAERHGGTLDLVQNRPGERGARFLLRLPRRQSRQSRENVKLRGA